jgi:hypothetical protein
MLDFRKVLLGLSVAGLGLVSTASAQQITCGPAAISGGGAASIVAVEGLTELIPGVTVSCTPTGTVPNFASITLTSDVAFSAGTTSGGAVDVVATATGTGLTTAPTGVVTQNGATLVANFNLTGATGISGFTFSGLRVNASTVPANSQITIQPSGTPGGGIVDTATAAQTLTAAFASTSLGVPTLKLSPSQSVCSISSKTPPPVSVLTIQEVYPRALKTIADVQGPSAVVVTQGTRVAVTFNNLNSGVNYYVPATTGSGTLVLTAYPSATGVTPLTAQTAGSGAGILNNVVLLTATAGSVTVYYGTTNDDGGSIATATITLSELVPVASAVVTPSTALVTSNAYLVGVATGYPQYVAVTTPTTISDPTSALTTNSLLLACNTTLLFPFVTNMAGSGFDTGIEIANTSTSGTGGTCTINFYGTSATNTAQTTIPYTTPILLPGTIQTAITSSIAPGINGYAIAVCNFTNAHGDAFLGQFGVGGHLAANYLGVVTGAAGVSPPANLTAQ